MPERYERIVRYVLETPWAIQPKALGVILEILEFRTEGGKFTDEELKARLEDTETRQASRQDRVAVIPIFGPIFPRANLFTEFSGGTSIQKLSAMLKEADRDSDVSTIILDVDSPGGVVDMVPETGELIRNLNTPTVAVANATAASAAYWLAAQADELIVTPSGEVGSIGVWTAHQDISGMESKLGVQTTLVSAGKYKVEGHPFGPLEKEARAELQRKVDHYYDMFTREVGLGREVSPKTVREGFGEGRMLTAPDAVREGMADRIATLDEIIAERSNGVMPVAVAASAQVTSYFDNPTFGVPGSDARLKYDPHNDKWSSPVTIDGDHVYGHVTPEGICLIGSPGRCINPPNGDLEGFMRHYAPAAGGRRTGVITLADRSEHGHSTKGIGADEATKWYDSVGRGVADVRVGVDAYGIWFSGMVRPGCHKDDRYALAASDVSGHWEADRNGQPMLVGLPAVNVGGFRKGYLTAEEVASGVAASASVDTDDCEPCLESRVDDLEVLVEELRELALAGMVDE